MRLRESPRAGVEAHLGRARSSANPLHTQLEQLDSRAMAHHQPSNTAAPLSELVLSSTASASPLPTLSLHHPLTGALVYSFRAPVANSNIATTGGAPGSARSKGKDAQDEGQSLDGRRTLALVEGANGMGGFIAGLGGKDGRAGLNVWNFTRVRSLAFSLPRLDALARARVDID